MTAQARGAGGLPGQTEQSNMTQRFDVLVVGGGINGVGIARDARPAA